MGQQQQQQRSGTSSGSSHAGRLQEVAAGERGARGAGAGLKLGQLAQLLVACGCGIQEWL
jgi:hypothetical protein